MIETLLTKQLNIEYPIVEGGMVWAGGEELALEVTKQGGLGTIGGGSCLGKAELQAKIDYIRAHTDRPFAVNIPMLYPHADLLFEVSLENKVPVVITSAGNPKKYTKRLKEAGILVMHVVANEKFALKAQEAGVDFIIAEGIEAGGHNGKDELSTLVLVSNLVQKLKTPVLAAGGIAKGEHVLAMLALGAVGVQVGTVFAASKESSAHLNYKQALIDSKDNATIISGRRVAPVRSLSNTLSQQILAWEYSDMTNHELLKRIGHGVSYKAIIEGDIEHGSALAGQSSVFIKNLESVADIFTRLKSEFKKSNERLRRYYN